jgi:chromatin segregation and condensation protein Rec8/ScpA/Scc1 (kleisin family)
MIKVELFWRLLKNSNDIKRVFNSYKKITKRRHEKEELKEKEERRRELNREIARAEFNNNQSRGIYYMGGKELFKRMNDLSQIEFQKRLEEIEEELNTTEASRLLEEYYKRVFKGEYTPRGLKINSDLKEGN